jgi:uncharacterized protein (DUF58 family)
LHRSPFHGFSVEFSEYRPYSPGDDPRYLDWRLYARTDRYFVKRFEDETNLRCYLLVDQSRSMGYGSTPYTKAEYATTAAATLAYFLSSQRDAVGLLTFGERIVEYLPARYRPGHLHRLMMSLERAVAGAATDIGSPIEQIAKTVAKRGLVILISDLLTPVDPLEQGLRYLRSRGHEVVLLRILDPEESDFAFDHPAMFYDLESGRQLYVDPKAARDEYLRRFGEHNERIRQACSDLEIDYYPFTTDRPLELVLFDYLHSRVRRGRMSSRRRVGPRSPSAGRTT